MDWKTALFYLGIVLPPLFLLGSIKLTWGKARQFSSFLILVSGLLLSVLSKMGIKRLEQQFFTNGSSFFEQSLRYEMDSVTSRNDFIEAVKDQPSKEEKETFITRLYCLGSIKVEEETLKRFAEFNAQLANAAGCTESHLNRASLVDSTLTKAQAKDFANLNVEIFRSGCCKSVPKLADLHQDNRRNVVQMLKAVAELGGARTSEIVDKYTSGKELALVEDCELKRTFFNLAPKLNSKDLRSGIFWHFCY